MEYVLIFKYNYLNINYNIKNNGTYIRIRHINEMYWFNVS